MFIQTVDDDVIENRFSEDERETEARRFSQPKEERKRASLDSPIFSGSMVNSRDFKHINTRQINSNTYSMSKVEKAKNVTSHSTVNKNYVNSSFIH